MMGVRHSQLLCVATILAPGIVRTLSASSRRASAAGVNHRTQLPDLYFFVASLGSKLRTISFHISCFSLGSLNGSHPCVALIALSEMDLNTGSSLPFMTSGVRANL